MEENYITELIKNNPPLINVDIACIFSRLLNGILAKEEKNINHCELKIQNLLIK